MSLFQKHLFVVEPNREERSTLGFLLKLAGYGVTAVQDGAEAINWLAKRQEASPPFDLLLLSSRLVESDLEQIVFASRATAVRQPVLIINRTAAPRIRGEAIGMCKPTDVIETLFAHFRA